MRLISLSANQPTFRKVTFKRTGISLVLAEEKAQKAKGTDTYNGVGKSLMFALIHYCLGSNKVDAFEVHLKGWVFMLTVELDGSDHVIERRADKANEIKLDGKSIALSKLRTLLHEAAFETKVGLPHLKFRALITRFMRSGRSAYNEFAYTAKRESRVPYQAMLRSACLLGLDLKLARAKYDLRTSQVKLLETMKQLRQNPVFANLFEAGTVDIELAGLREEAQRLEADLKAFRVAEDYHQIEVDANAIKRELGLLRRKAVKAEQALAQIDRSLVTKGDLPAEKVIALYEEVQADLPSLVKKRIEEVQAFQADLKKKRIFRLTNERQEQVHRLTECEKAVADASKRLNERLRYLSEHHALDEYLAVSNELSSAKAKMAKLEHSKAVRDAADRDLARIKVRMAEGNIATGEYLDRSTDLIEEASALFRSYSKSLYGPRRSGLTVANDPGENQQRYKIEAHISSDAAQGINEAKIFCFDLMLVALQRRHRVRFLGHDSTLYDPIDPRQRLAMFRVAERVCTELDVQYIVALNLHDVTSIREQVPDCEPDFERLFESTVVRRLTDRPEDMLLGVELGEMKYDA